MMKGEGLDYNRTIHRQAGNWIVHKMNMMKAVGLDYSKTIPSQAGCWFVHMMNFEDHKRGLQGILPNPLDWPSP